MESLRISLSEKMTKSRTRLSFDCQVVRLSTALPLPARHRQAEQGPVNVPNKCVAEVPCVVVLTIASPEYLGYVFAPSLPVDVTYPDAATAIVLLKFDHRNTIAPAQCGQISIRAPSDRDTRRWTQLVHKRLPHKC
jgi:hypothetical protein